MTRTLPAIVLIGLASISSVAAQPAASPSPAEPRLAVRATGGLTGFALGEAAAFHQAAAEAYVGAGVPIPTQRLFPPSPSLGLDVLWSLGSGRHVGGGLRYASSEASSLYGDYAGTLDLVSRVSVVFAEAVGTRDLVSVGPARSFAGVRGGAVLASSRTDETLDLGTLGSTEGVLSGRGVGYSAEGFGGLSTEVGTVGVSLQGGYRIARVGRLDGKATGGGEAARRGQLPYALSLSGWSAGIGLTVPLGL